LSVELFKKIQQAEAEAEGMRQEAARLAREQVKAVEEALSAENRQTAAEVREEAQRVLADATAEVEKEIDALKQKRGAEREAQKAAAERRVSQAGQAIFERIVLHGNR
jgi:hypothetical protein